MFSRSSEIPRTDEGLSFTLGSIRIQISLIQCYFLLFSLLESVAAVTILHLQKKKPTSVFEMLSQR